jgi:N-acyl-D-aspartate/D-glutamate deacylase
VEEIATNLEKRGGAESLLVVGYEPDTACNGKSLAEISGLRNEPVIETIINLLTTGDSPVISFNMNEKDVKRFMRKDYVMTSSDGHVEVPGNDMPHPRNYGAFPHKLRKYVFEDKVITLEHAIRAATVLPADMLGLPERGRIEEGCIADIIIWDPETIRDLSTYTNPHRYSTGIEYMWINGQLVIENGAFNETLAGKTLRKNRNKIP